MAGKLYCEVFEGEGDEVWGPASASGIIISRSKSCSSRPLGGNCPIVDHQFTETEMNSHSCW